MGTEVPWSWPGLQASGTHWDGAAEELSLTQTVTCSSGLCSRRPLHWAPVPVQAGSCRDGAARCLGCLDSRQLPCPRLNGVLSQLC